MRPHVPPTPSAGCRSACSLVAVGQRSWDLFRSPSCLSGRRDWGIENFISPTLLRNMRGKDIKKAISYHMKRNQILLDPRQKHMLAAVQVRLNYLQILSDLKMYNGKIFNATLMVWVLFINVIGVWYAVSMPPLCIFHAVYLDNNWESRTQGVVLPFFFPLVNKIRSKPKQTLSKARIFKYCSTLLM